MVNNNLRVCRGRGGGGGVGIDFHECPSNNVFMVKEMS